MFAFDDPPTTVNENRCFQCIEQISWRDTKLVDGIDTRHLVVSLIYKCLNLLLRDKGMKYSVITKHGKNRKNMEQWYIPQGFLDKDRVSFTFPMWKEELV